MATPQTMVCDTAADLPPAVPVFGKFGIDRCCADRSLLAQASEEQSLRPRTAFCSITGTEPVHLSDTRDWAIAPLSSLCAHIVETHHACTRAQLPSLRQSAQRVASRHAEAHPELGEIQYRVEFLTANLFRHLGREETILFPAIARLERRSPDRGTGAPVCIGSVRRFIRLMMAEHDAAGEAFAEVRELTRDFTPPEGACPAHRTFYAALDSFGRGLHRHVHIESSVLFPRAIELEQSLR